MLTIIVIGLIAITFLVMVTMILTSGRQLHKVTPSSQSASEVIEPAVSATVYGLITVVRHVIKYLSIRLLIVLHTFVSIGRAILTRIEKRFSLLIDAVRGRAPNDRHRGSVSFFLERLKDHKEEMARRENIR